MEMSDTRGNLTALFKQYRRAASVATSIDRLSQRLRYLEQGRLQNSNRSTPSGTMEMGRDGLTLYFQVSVLAAEDLPGREALD